MLSRYLRPIGIIRSLTEYAMVLPIVLLLHIYLIPESPSHTILLSLVYPVCHWGGQQAKSWIRWQRDTLWLTGGLFLTMTVVVITGQITLTHFIPPLISFSLFARGVRMASRGVPMWGSVTWYWGALAVYFVIYALTNFLPEMKAYQLPLFIGGVWMIVTTLMMMNQNILHRANMTRDTTTKLPAGILRQNLKYVFALIGITLLFAAMIFGNLMDILMGWFRQVMAWLFNNRTTEVEPPRAEPTVTPQMPMEGLEPGEPSAFMKALEQIVIILFWSAMIIAVVILLWIGLRYLIKKLFPKFWAALLRFFAQKQEYTPAASYSDERTNLFEWDKLRQRVTQPWEKILARFGQKEAAYAELTNNRDRVRYWYRFKMKRAMRKGFIVQESATPAEILMKVKEWEQHDSSSDFTDLADAYNASRYSDQDIPDETVERLRKKFDPPSSS
ncbi:DUF4129 domain-containing protein [Paenibacillus guangzhouensis]|uniref:DUF4129 domain-containing protein n=1 Tax=Paenibacillus guangzhouensis TaxID=1473112 RepID=UPI001267548F|nr:DUF4129 domain-containing protein [Paenibacillus guangzhouensis]